MDINECARTPAFMAHGASMGTKLPGSWMAALVTRQLGAARHQECTAATYKDRAQASGMRQI
jgi:hypothetical protein